MSKDRVDGEWTSVANSSYNKYTKFRLKIYQVKFICNKNLKFNATFSPLFNDFSLMINNSCWAVVGSVLLLESVTFTLTSGCCFFQHQIFTLQFNTSLMLLLSIPNKVR